MHKIEKTHLFTSERGIKCCRVDISKEQSNIILAPLNCSTWHGAELVLPKEYCKTKWNNPKIKQRKIIIIKLVRISSLYAYQLHSFLLFSQRFFKIIQTLIEPPFWIIIINRWTKWLTKPSPPEKKINARSTTSFLYRSNRCSYAEKGFCAARASWNEDVSSVRGCTARFFFYVILSIFEVYFQFFFSFHLILFAGWSLGFNSAVEALNSVPQDILVEMVRIITLTFK